MNKKLLLKKVLKEILPTKEEEEKEEKIIEEIFHEIKNKFKGVEPILVGSLAKGTDLREDKDIDIFIKFHKDVPRNELEKKGLDIGKKIFKKLKAKYEIDYAEHPYIIGEYKGYKIEIVPCYDVTKPKSAVDRTPFHTEYIKGKIQDNEILRNEILLLKQFMKGIGVYGAEAKIQGFSGYLTELLVINYGSFERVLRYAAKWKIPKVIDIEHLWKENSIEDLKYFFPDDDLIVIDPIDKYRNVAAAVSKQKLSEFIIAARKFSQEPKKEFFFPRQKKPLPEEKLWKKISSRETKIIVLFFTHKKRINPNILYSQLRKTKFYIEKEVEDKGFKILKKGEWSDDKNKKSALIFEFLIWKLPKIEHHIGPFIANSKIEDQDKFLKKYKNAYIEGDRWVVDKKREFPNVITLIKKILKEKKGFGKDLKREKETKVKILQDKEIFKVKDKEFLIFLREFFKF